MSNKIGRITKLARETKDAKFYEVETLTTDLMTVTDTLTCAAISTTPAIGDLVVLVEVQGKLFITGGAVDKNILGQVTSVADDGQLTVALYEDGSTTALSETTHERKAATQSVTAFQEAYGVADLKVNDWVKCYQLQDVWYVNNLDWTTAASEDLGAGQEVDFIVDNFDRADSDDLGAYWGAGYALRDTTAISKSGAPSLSDHIAASSSNVVSNAYTTAAYVTSGATLQSQALAVDVSISSFIDGVVMADTHSDTTAPLAEGILTSVSQGRTLNSRVRRFQGATIAVPYLHPLRLPTYTVLATFRHTGEVQALTAEVNQGVQTPIGILTRGVMLGGTISNGVFSSFYAETYAAMASISAGAAYTVSASAAATVLFEGETYNASASLTDAASLSATLAAAPEQTLIGYTHALLSGVSLSEAHISLETVGALTDTATPAVLHLRDIAATSEGAVPLYVDAYLQARVGSDWVPTAALVSQSGLAPITPVATTPIRGLNTLKVMLDGTSVVCYLNGTLIDSYGQNFLLDGTYVGLVAAGAHLEQQLVSLDMVEGFSGVTQFKAWVGGIEPPNAESGHGDFVDGLPVYTDGYHSTDVNGVVTYNPNE